MFLVNQRLVENASAWTAEGALRGSEQPGSHNLAEEVVERRAIFLNDKLKSLRLDAEYDQCSLQQKLDKIL